MPKAQTTRCASVAFATGFASSFGNDASIIVHHAKQGLSTLREFTQMTPIACFSSRLMWLATEPWSWDDSAATERKEVISMQDNSAVEQIHAAAKAGDAQGVARLL